MARFTLLLLVLLASVVSTSAQTASSNRPAQASTPTTPTMESLNIPAQTAFLAKLSMNLTLTQCKQGDPVEAETRQDVKQGKQVLLKKGSTLLGHVSAVQLATAEKPENKVGIVFDSVKMQKTGQLFSLHLIVQALAPDSNVDRNGSLADATGTGVQAATRQAGVSGHASTISGDVNSLTTESTGIYDISGVKLGEQVSSTGHITVLAASVGDFHLKKGMQLVMRVVEQ